MGHITSITSNTLYSAQATLDASQQLGEIVEGNGKRFVRVKAGASNLVVGNVVQAPAISTDFDDLAVAAAAAIGANQVTVTLGSTLVAANLFQGGSVTFSTGEERKIISHPAAAANAAVILTLDAPLAVALTTSSTATLRNIYNGVIQAPTTLTGAVVGIAVYAIPASNYGWLQIYGECGILSDNSTGGVGSAIANSAATAGAAGVFVAGTTRAFLGHVTRALSSAKLITAKINI